MNLVTTREVSRLTRSDALQSSATTLVVVCNHLPLRDAYLAAVRADIICGCLSLSTHLGTNCCDASLFFCSFKYSAFTSAPVRSKNQSGTSVSGATGRMTCWGWWGRRGSKARHKTRVNKRRGKGFAEDGGGGQNPHARFVNWTTRARFKQESGRSRNVPQPARTYAAATREQLVILATPCQRLGSHLSLPVNRR